MHLQLITDTRLQSRFSHFELGARAFRAGGPLVQYRNKDYVPERDLEDLRRLVALADQYGAKVIVNDSMALAAEAGAQALHLGKNDGSPTEARALLGDGVMIGATEHD